MTEKLTREKFLENQREYCREKGFPFFMPSNGICYKCKRDIVPRLIEEAHSGREHITGCPLCFYSYCD